MLEIWGTLFIQYAARSEERTESDVATHREKTPAKKGTGMGWEKKFLNLEGENPTNKNAQKDKACGILIEAKGYRGEL